MHQCAERIRVLFLERFLSLADNPDRVMERQDVQWRSFLERDPNPERSLWDLRRGAALRSLDFVAWSLTVMLTPHAHMVPFFVPPKAVRFAERPLEEFSGVFRLSGARIPALVFAAEVLVIGHASAEQEGLLTEDVSARYAVLFPAAQHIFSQENTLSASLRERERRNLHFHGSLSAA